MTVQQGMTMRPGRLLVIAVGCAFATGCRTDPKLVPVSGVVTLDGKPLPCGGVMFQPDTGPAAMAAIGPDGRFTMRYQARAAGAVAGRNRVVVTAYESELPGYQQPSGRESAPGKSLVPEKYTSVSTTDIHVDVRPGMGDVEIPLVSAP